MCERNSGLLNCLRMALSVRLVFCSLNPGLSPPPHHETLNIQKVGPKEKQTVESAWWAMKLWREEILHNRTICLCGSEIQSSAAMKRKNWCIILNTTCQSFPLGTKLEMLFDLHCKTWNGLEMAFKSASGLEYEAFLSQVKCCNVL